MKLVIILLTFLIIQGCNEGDGKVLSNGSDVKEALQELKSQKKFVENFPLFNPSAPNEATRVEAEKVINAALLKLIDTSNNNLSEKAFWATLEIVASQLAEMDSEEMDRGFTYMEEIMDIYNIESSDGRFNEWRYGFDPTSSH